MSESWCSSCPAVIGRIDGTAGRPVSVGEAATFCVVRAGHLATASHSNADGPGGAHCVRAMPGGRRAERPAALGPQSQ